MYISPVTGDDSLHDGKPNAGAFKLVRSVQTFEYSKELVCMFHVEPNAVASDAIVDPAVVYPPIHLDYRFISPAVNLNALESRLNHACRMSPTAG